MFPAALLAVVVVNLLGGCAVHRYDPATGTHTLYGLGVLRVRTQTASNGQQAVGSSVQTFGATLALSPDDTSFSLGYKRRDRLVVVSPDAQVALAYPEGGLFSATLLDAFPVPGATPAPDPAAPVVFPLLPPGPASRPVP